MMFEMMDWLSLGVGLADDATGWKPLTVLEMLELGPMFMILVVTLAKILGPRGIFCVAEPHMGRSWFQSF